ncbi:MAG: hypothetical protein ACRDCW_06745 [Sarcina sp.]
MELFKNLKIVNEDFFKIVNTYVRKEDIVNFEIIVVTMGKSTRARLTILYAELNETAQESVALEREYEEGIEKEIMNTIENYVFENLIVPKKDRKLIKKKVDNE